MQQVLIEYRPALFFPPRTGPWLVGKITFVPGVKNYSFIDWEEIKNNSSLRTIIEHSIKIGILRVISQSPLNTESETPPLPKNQQEAIALVQKTYSMSLLQEWQEIEKRKPILDVLALQIKKGEEGSALKDKGNENVAV